MHINFRAPCNKLGFGIFSIIYFKHMINAGHDVSWKQIGNTDITVGLELCDTFDIDHKAYTQAIVAPLKKSEPLFTIWHHHDLAYEDYRIKALIHFETDRFTELEHQNFSKVDSAYVCSTWGQDILAAEKVKCEIGHLPGICGSLEANMTTEANPAIAKVYDLLKHNMGYSAVYTSIGKWEIRKQQKVLISMCNKLHTIYNPIILGFWYNGFLQSGEENQHTFLKSTGFKIKQVIDLSSSIGTQITIYTNKKSNVDFGIVEHVPSYIDLLEFINDSDGYLTISAGEGWDQPLTEAMGLGKICLFSNNTAHSHYAHSDNAIPIKCTRQVAYDNKWFKGDRGCWYPVIQDRCIDALYSFLKITHELDLYTVERNNLSTNAVQRMNSEVLALNRMMDNLGWWYTNEV